MAFSILEQIKIRLRQFETVVDANGDTQLDFTEPNENFVILNLVDKAKQDIRMYRHYPASYTEEDIEKDIAENYSNILVELVLFDYATEGAEFETTHNENGVNRTFVKRESILGKVIPFCNVL